MTTTPKPKSFDCIEFKREAQAQIYDEIKNLSPVEQIEYFKKRAESGPLGEWWKRIKSNASQGQSAGSI